MKATQDALNHLKKFSQDVFVKVEKFGCSGYRYKLLPAAENVNGLIGEKLDDVTLWYDPRFEKLITDCTVHLQKDSIGNSVIVFQQENIEATTCGCGKSFHVAEF